MHDYATLLTLSLLGIQNKTLGIVFTDFSSDEIEDLLKGHVLELQFKYNVFEDKEINNLLNQNTVNKAIEQSNRILYNSKKRNIQVISIFDEKYPNNLKKIQNPPLFLYALGDTKLLKETRSFACVGTRHPSNEAIDMVKSTVKGLVQEDYIVISGLAYGIDFEAHNATLVNHGKTIAVLAHGLDDLYPKEHSLLSKNIVKNGGLLLSEYPIFTKSKKDFFVQRNRIVSGLSKAVIIFEAEERSGTMHTARFAYKQGKKIFCPSNNYSSGVRKLMSSNSALPFKSYSEIINLVSDQKPRKENGTQSLFKGDIKKSLQLHSEMLNSVQEIREHQKVTVRLEKEIYKEIQKISTNHNLSTKELMNFILKNFLDQFKEDVVNNE